MQIWILKLCTEEKEKINGWVAIVQEKKDKSIRKVKQRDIRQQNAMQVEEATWYKMRDGPSQT